ncbi:MAG: hypothetical protein V1837_00450 [Candidatus Woesearchaeota archaeon]
MQAQKFFLKPELIYRFLTLHDDKLETTIMCSGLDLITTDQAIYEALASVEDRSAIDMNKLVKLLEVTQIVSHLNSTQKERAVLSHGKAEEIRALALK